MVLINLQIGKNKLTKEFIENLRVLFKKAEHIRVSVLKSATRDKKQIETWAKEIVEALGKNYTFKTIGFTITLRKWRANFVRK
jgi:RNA-binding protein YhbY